MKYEVMMTVLYYISDGPTNWPKHVAGIITEYNLMKYEVAYDRITLYIYIYIYIYIYKIWPYKLAETCSWNYNLMKYEVMYECIILYIRLPYKLAETCSWNYNLI